MTNHIDCKQAYNWGLVDVCGDNSQLLLGKHLSRLKVLSPAALIRYKQYTKQVVGDLMDLKNVAVKENQANFSQPKVVAAIKEYVANGKLPWQE